MLDGSLQQSMDGIAVCVCPGIRVPEQRSEERDHGEIRVDALLHIQRTDLQAARGTAENQGDRVRDAPGPGNRVGPCLRRISQAEEAVIRCRFQLSLHER